MNKKQMNEAINKKLGYELLKAYEQYSYSEIKMLYKSIVIDNYKVYYDGNNAYVAP